MTFIFSILVGAGLAALGILIAIWFYLIFNTPATELHWHNVITLIFLLLVLAFYVVYEAGHEEATTQQLQELSP